MLIARHKIPLCGIKLHFFILISVQWLFCIFNMKIILFKHMHSSCIQIMYIQNSIFTNYRFILNI